MIEANLTSSVFRVVYCTTPEFQSEGITSYYTESGDFMRSKPTSKWESNPLVVIKDYSNT